ncbi:hypothetical protein [Desmonostoc muscorum]|nr:hypothetical protein [Desmonostoc muscorum]
MRSDVYDGLRLRLAENLKNKAIAGCGRVSAITLFIVRHSSRAA